MSTITIFLKLTGDAERAEIIRTLLLLRALSQSETHHVFDRIELSSIGKVGDIIRYEPDNQEGRTVYFVQGRDQQRFESDSHSVGSTTDSLTNPAPIFNSLTEIADMYYSNITEVCHAYFDAIRSEQCLPVLTKYGITLEDAIEYAETKMCCGIIDLQNDFCPGGSLAVTGGNEVFEAVNEFKKLFSEATFITRDSHVQDDVTFASTYKVDPFTKIEVEYPESNENKKLEMVWPNHCIEGTHGCELSPLLELDGSEVEFKKGFGKRESYSAVLDTLGEPSTPLLSWLDAKMFDVVFISGLARDYCAGGTAEDLSSAGKVVFMLEDGTKPVADASNEEITKRLLASGVTSVYMRELI